MNRFNLVAFLVLCSFLGTLAKGDTISTTSGIRTVENPISNGDIRLRVKVGSTPTDALNVVGTTGAITIPSMSTGVVHSGSGGALTSSNVVNADVDAAAAIAGSKIVAASASVAGVVSTGTQTFAGSKQFNDGFNVPVFSVYRSSNQSINNGADTKIQFNTERVDNFGYYDNATNFRYTPLIAGVYHISLCVLMQDMIDDKSIQLQIWRNGSNFADFRTATGGTTAIDDGACVDAFIDLNGSTDYIEAYVNQGDTVSRNLAGGSVLVLSRFGGNFVGKQ